MNIKKNNLPKNELEIVVTVETSELKPYLDKAAAKISQEVNIPGFRKGHVPYDILKKNVGEASIYEEAAYDAVNKILADIIIKDKIDFVGQPKVDFEKIAPGNPLVFKAVIALMPTVKLGNYKELKAKKKPVIIDEKKVKQTFLDLRKMRAQEKIVNREAKKGDKVQLDFTIKLAGVVIEGGQAQNFDLVLGEGKFIPGFEEQVVGLKKDAIKDFKITFPKDYFEKKLAGRECDVNIKINAVYEITLPELNDEMAQSYNFKDKKELEDKIRDNIKHELEQKENERLELEIIEEIINLSEFGEFSDVLISAETEKMWHELQHSIEDAGGKIEDYLKHIKKEEKDFKKEWQPQAEKRIKAALITRAVAEAEKIIVDEKEVAEELKKMTAAYEKMPEMKKQFNSPAYKNYLMNLLMNKKTFERLTSFIK